MATTTIASAAVGPPLTSSERWTSYSALVLAICILGWAFDIYEATIMQLVTPILIKEWGITPATIGTVTTLSRWIGLIGTFLFPVLADLYGRRPALIWSILVYAVFTGFTGFSTGWVTLLIWPLPVPKVRTSFGSEPTPTVTVPVSPASVVLKLFLYSVVAKPSAAPVAPPMVIPTLLAAS